MTQTIDPPHVRNLMSGGSPVRLIDVRSPGEFAARHIPGSVNIPLDVLRSRSDAVVVRHEDPIVLVCASGARAEQAATLLDERGTAEPAVLAGGLQQWERAGGDVRSGRGGWAMERQVRLAAGSLVLAGVLGSTVYRPMKWLAGFVGAGLGTAALTDTCALSRVLARLPVNRRTSATDFDAGLRTLTR